jgi:hypothetical protein
MHDGKNKVLGNGALYKKATKGQTPLSSTYHTSKNGGVL